MKVVKPVMRNKFNFLIHIHSSLTHLVSYSPSVTSYLFMVLLQFIIYLVVLTTHLLIIIIYIRFTTFSAYDKSFKLSLLA